MLSRYQRGKWAEYLCIAILRLKGYRILAHRFRGYDGGDIDIIAFRNRAVIIIEVKYRHSLSSATESLHPKQIKKLEFLYRCFVSRYPQYAHYSARFDLFVCAPFCWPRHYKNAWDYS